MLFQSTRPCGARSLTIMNIRLVNMQFQSTRPCGARCGRHGVIDHGQEVSIHAPLRSAMRIDTALVFGTFKFQSTRPCGARFRVRGGGRGVLGVSIHAPLRSAILDPGRNNGTVNVSIHAPLRSAISRPPGWRSGRRSFNPRAPAERDMAENLTPMAFKMFQSTRPCGARSLSGHWAKTSFAGFNPRAPAERDGESRARMRCGVRFNPRAPAERDASRPFTLARTVEFQSTRPCGARSVILVRLARYIMFQSTRPCGARYKPACIKHLIDRVSIHAPLRSAI